MDPLGGDSAFDERGLGVLEDAVLGAEVVGSDGGEALDDLVALVGVAPPGAVGGEEDALGLIAGHGRAEPALDAVGIGAEEAAEGGVGGDEGTGLFDADGVGREEVDGVADAEGVWVEVVVLDVEGDLGGRRKIIKTRGLDGGAGPRGWGVGLRLLFLMLWVSSGGVVNGASRAGAKVGPGGGAGWARAGAVDVLSAKTHAMRVDAKRNARVLGVLVVMLGSGYGRCWLWAAADTL